MCRTGHMPSPVGHRTASEICSHQLPSARHIQSGFDLWLVYLQVGRKGRRGREGVSEEGWEGGREGGKEGGCVGEREREGGRKVHVPSGAFFASYFISTTASSIALTSQINSMRA